MKKYVAPLLSALVIVALAVGYALFFFLIIRGNDVTTPVKVIIVAIVLFVVIGVSAALVSRIKELRGGQEDGLSKY